jgi:hypothetical protein
MSRRVSVWTLALCGFLVGSGGPAAWADGPPTAGKETISTGTLRAPSPEATRSQALDWLKGVRPMADTTQKEFDAIWNDSDRSVLDRVAGTLSLGDPQAAKLLLEARDPATTAPTKVPAVLKDEKQSAFYRANLALAYAKALSNRRIHEEALDALRVVKPENVVDPAGYFFIRAVAEHALLLKNEAFRSIVGVVEDVADSPDRYKIVSLLMLYDMQTWKDKDLGWIARKMDNIERRLELARGGPQTQKMQTEVVRRLDEIIKEMENQRKGS